MTKREIRFRVWNGRDKKWLHAPNQEVNLFGEAILLGEFMRIDLEGLNDCVALQFTGVSDKNKKEIYEGDIIRYESGGTARNAEVWWDEEFAMFCFDHDYEFTFMDKVQNIEVVGNIFETPDLLE